MTRFMCALGGAVVIAGASLVAHAQGPTPSSNGLSDVQTTGCLRLWRPAPGDPTKMPPDRQPGVAGVYLLTPLNTTGGPTDLPTYVLMPSATLGFAQHVGHEVEITGTAQAASPAPASQNIAFATVQRPENMPSTNGLARLTITTMKVVRESCP